MAESTPQHSSTQVAANDDLYDDVWGDAIKADDPRQHEKMLADLAANRSSSAMDDVWGDDDTENTNQPAEMLSDLPSMKRQHMTDGYREGLSIGKARVMQEGFDSGYPMGVELGLRVGKILGVLEGYLASSSIQTHPDMLDVVRKTHTKAQSELAIAKLLENVDEATLLSTTIIPESALNVLGRWEKTVLGFRV